MTAKSYFASPTRGSTSEVPRSRRFSRMITKVHGCCSIVPPPRTTVPYVHVTYGTYHSDGGGHASRFLDLQNPPFCVRKHQYWKWERTVHMYWFRAANQWLDITAAKGKCYLKSASTCSFNSSWSEQARVIPLPRLPDIGTRYTTFGICGYWRGWQALVKDLTPRGRYVTSQDSRFPTELGPQCNRRSQQQECFTGVKPPDQLLTMHLFA